jgi:PTH2 family peptidyl-tRNA hydrolase
MKLTSKQKQLKKNLDMDVKMIFCVRTDLNMGKGKIGSQIGHCAIILYKDLLKSNNKLLDVWENTGSKKIVVKVQSSKEMYKIKDFADNFNIPNNVITDAGKTQIESGSQTILGIFGESKYLNQFTRHLKLM